MRGLSEIGLPAPCTGSAILCVATFIPSDRTPKELSCLAPTLPEKTRPFVCRTRESSNGTGRATYVLASFLFLPSSSEKVAAYASCVVSPCFLFRSPRRRSVLVAEARCGLRQMFGSCGFRSSFTGFSDRIHLNPSVRVETGNPAQIELGRRDAYPRR